MSSGESQVDSIECCCEILSINEYDVSKDKMCVCVYVELSLHGILNYGELCGSRKNRW